MRAFGSDVAAVVGTLGLTEVVLIGHSMGGPVVMEAEKMLGGRAIGVVGVDTFYTGFAYPTGTKVAEFIKPLEENFAAETEKFIRSMFMPTTDPALVDRIAKSFVSAKKEVAISALKEIFAWYEADSEKAFERVGSKLLNIDADPRGRANPYIPASCSSPVSAILSPRRSRRNSIGSSTALSSSSLTGPRNADGLIERCDDIWLWPCGVFSYARAHP